MATTQPFTILRASGEALVLDAAITYTLSGSVAVTEHAVEDGVVFADHAQPQPTNLSVRGVVTETPFDFQSDTGGRAHVDAARDFVIAIQGERVTVVCDAFGTLENMALTRWEAPKTKALDLKFSLDFRQVRVAVATFVTISPEQVAVASTATEPEISAEANLPDGQDIGEQGATSTATNAEQEAADQSYLLALLEGVGVEL